MPTSSVSPGFIPKAGTATDPQTYLAAPGNYGKLQLKAFNHFRAQAPGVELTQLEFGGDDSSVLGGYRGDDWRSGYWIKIKTAPGFNKAIQFTSAAKNKFYIYGVEIDGHLNDSGTVATDDGIYAFGITDLTVDECYIHDLLRAPFITGNLSNFKLIRSVIARNRSIPSSHSEAIADNASDGVLILESIFEDISGTGFIVQLRRSATGDNRASNWAIRGCCFNHTKAFRDAYAAGQVQGLGNGAICGTDSDKIEVENWDIKKLLALNLVRLNSGVYFPYGPGGIRVTDSKWFNCSPSNVTGNNVVESGSWRDNEMPAGKRYLTNDAFTYDSQTGEVLIGPPPVEIIEPAKPGETFTRDRDGAKFIYRESMEVAP